MAQENNGSPPRSDRKLTRSERFRVAGLAFVDPRSVDKYFAGAPLRDSTAERITNAIRDLDSSKKASGAT
jgi:hypothetical protein